jgi:preprotein translocase, SecE subunit, bacterial
MGRIVGYFKGVRKEAGRVRWPKKDALLPAIVTVLIITAFTAIFLLVEDLAAGTLIQQLRDAFSSIRG